jgi:hypothetical protein
MAPLPFKSLFCQRFGCQPEEYEKRAFRQCLYWHARFLAPLIRIISPSFFVHDIKFIRYLGESVSARDVVVDLAEFADLNRGQAKSLRSGLRICVSVRKAGQLAFRLIREANEANAGKTVK